jgi:hypothetical protein
VRSRLVTRTDFLSYGAQGKIPPRNQQGNPDFLRKWDGLSVFTSYAGAWGNASLYRWRMGEYIAELEISDDAGVAYEQPDYKGHLNLYDVDADLLMGCVTRIVHGPTTPVAEFSARDE